jgi:bifunctional lysine-specific demethylase and histidyl-hydroxylase MINA
MRKRIFSDTFIKEFFSNNFGKNYLHKKNILQNSQDTMSLDILNELLSIKSNWTNKNFKMILDRQPINYSKFSSLSLEHSAEILRPDVDKVQNWISKGSSLVLNEIEKLTNKLQDIVNELQNLTNGKCQGNLYFSMQSRQAFGPHCDDHDVFAIHFEGEKVWNIYENVEKNPINHPMFKYSAEERVKKAGKLIDQITLQSGDLLYLPRGQYHDALASQNGAIHIAFGLTYFKPIDLMSILWEKFIVNEFMRQDIEKDLTNESLKNSLKKMSLEISTIINNPQNINLASHCIKNWPYHHKDYSLKDITLKGKSYTVQKSITINKNGNDIFLSNGKDKVLIPKKYIDISKFILDHDVIFEEDILNNFKNLPKELVLECITNLHKMKVVT